MSAGAAARDSEFVRVHAPSPGMVPHEPHCAMNVLRDFGNMKLGLRAVHDCEHGVAALEEWRVRLGIDRFVARKEAAADHEQNGAPVRLDWLKNIQRQGGAELA